MKNRIRRIVFPVIVCLLFWGCSEKAYKQEYKTYKEYLGINPRNKSWFPENVFPTDAYNILNNSYSDPLCAFGKFEFHRNNYTELLNGDTNLVVIDCNTFERTLSKHQKRIPKWFISTSETHDVNNHFFQLDRFYLVVNDVRKTTHFILSN